MSSQKNRLFSQEGLVRIKTTVVDFNSKILLNYHTNNFVVANKQ